MALHETLGLKVYKYYPLTSIEFMVGYVVFYIVSTYLFQRYMETREKLNVTFIAKTHNLLLGSASALMAVALLAAAYFDGRFESHDAFHCHPYRSEPFFFVHYLFYLSKIWEMVDTFLLIANKKPVIWLHYIHHASTLMVAGKIPTQFFISIHF